MKERTWQAILTILGGVIAGIEGFVSAWWINKLQRDGEQAAALQNRRREFLAFMAQFRAQANWQYRKDEFYLFLRNVTPNFHHASSLIRKDIAAEKGQAFERFIVAVSTCDHGKNEEGNQEQLLKSIDALVLFVKES
jgi:hypothetical protein